MNAYVILAHPNPKSLNGRLKDKAVEALKSEGHKVKEIDLFASQFKTLADANDFTTLSNPAYFDLQAEQKFALENGTFVQDIKEEQEKLLWADLLVFQFPFWWYSMPAVLKGYIDRVLSLGFAYGGAKKLAGKKAIFCSTAGSGPDWLNDNTPAGSLEKILHHILYGVFAFCDMDVLEPFVVYKAKRIDELEKQKAIDQWGNILKDINSRKQLFT